MNGVNAEEFKRQLLSLSESFELVSIGKMIDNINSKKSGNYCSICFDDGLKCIQLALPILREIGVSATFFLSSMPIFYNKVLSVQKIHLLVSKMGYPEFRRQFMEKLSDIKCSYNDMDGIGINHIYKYDNPDIQEFKILLNFKISFEIRDRILNEIFYSHFNEYDENSMCNNLYLNLDDITTLIKQGHEIGSHFHSHCPLSLLGEEDQKREVEYGNQLLHRFGQEMKLFSYPYGSENTWSAITINSLRNCKCTAAFTMGRKDINNHYIENHYEIPRYSISDFKL